MRALWSPAADTASAALLARRGNLTIKQRKFGWIPFLPSLSEGSFLVGTFSAERIDDGDS